MTQARQLRRAVAASSSSASASATAVSDVQRMLDEAVAERDSLAAQLWEAQAVAAAAEGARARAAAAAETAEQQRQGLEQQLDNLRASLDTDSAAVAAADARVAGLQVRGGCVVWGRPLPPSSPARAEALPCQTHAHTLPTHPPATSPPLSAGWQSRVSSLATGLSRAEAEADRLSGLLAAAEAAAASAKSREDAARAAGREVAERSRRAEALHEDAQAEAAEVRGWRRRSRALSGQGVRLQERWRLDSEVRTHQPTPRRVLLVCTSASTTTTTHSCAGSWRQPSARHQRLALTPHAWQRSWRDARELRLLMTTA
jgi:hypothetical protein